MEREFDVHKLPDGEFVDLDAFKRKSWPGVTALFARIAAPVTYQFKFRSNSNCIILRELYRLDGETAVPGVERNSSKDLRGKLGYYPAGCDVEGWARIEKPASLTIVRVDSDGASRFPLHPADLPPRVDFDDPTVRHLMLRFQALLDDPSLDIPGYAETLAELLIFEVTRALRRTSLNGSEGGAQRGLAARQLRAVIDYVHDHLDEKITVSELAALVHFNRYHFMRAFKHAMGISPLQYVIRQRVERATALLNESGASITEVAVRTGFGSPVQMTRSFRRVVGTTPSAIRRGE
jgi:AraC family transcriptional regulator